MPIAAFVINPARARGPGLLRQRCREAAERAGWEPLLAETSAADGGQAAARQAVAAGAALLFAVGGDGTVRACAGAVAGTGVPLAIVPLGTANLAARALGLPLRLDAALAAGFSGRDRQVDVPVADGQVFVVMAGIGLDAAVVRATPGPLKDRLGWLAYALAGVPRLPGAGHRFRVRLDGGEPVARLARCVVAGNAGLLPGGFVLLPGARVDDGLLDAGILSPSGLLDWVPVAGQVLARSRRDSRFLERHQARRVEIEADTELPRQADGEVLSPGRSLTVTLRPKALTVRVAR
jgi:diacylglycerol kinase (ATP)